MSSADKGAPASGDFAAALLAAKQAHQRGDIAAAEPAYRAALALDGRNPGARYGLGMLLLQTGHPDEAVECLQITHEVDPGNMAVLHALGVAMAVAQRTGEAVAIFRDLAERAPQAVPVLSTLGHLLLDLGQNDEAAGVLQRAAALAPDSVPVLTDLAQALSSLKRYEEALLCHQHLVTLDPDEAANHNNLGLTLLMLGRPADAMAHFTRAVECDPTMLVALLNGGNALNDLGDPDAAVQWFEKALALDARFVPALAGVAAARRMQGRFDEARTAYEKAVALQPDVAGLHLALALIAPFVSEDRRLAPLEALARTADSMTPMEQSCVCFALSKAHMDLHQPEQALPLLHRANAQKRAITDYNEAATLEDMARITRQFDAGFMAAHAGGVPSDLPVFVLGMPRSGTSLVEQIIASHPDAFGAGELDDLATCLFPGIAPDTLLLRTPSLAPDSLTPERLQQAGAAYVERLRAHCPPGRTVRRIVDKMPGNFRFVGHIRLALPQARIIHVRRDPRDVCLSAYAVLFKRPLDYTYDLAELGHYWKAYDALMAHWRSVLPAGAMLEVRYEDLVADFDRVARQIIAFCGLPWDARCADFYRTDRLVRTASARQVRQPLYADSVGRWRAYADGLAPLLDALGPWSDRPVSG